MDIKYPRLPQVESASENEDGSGWGQNQKALEASSDVSMKDVGEDSDNGVNQLSGLLNKLVIKPDKNSSKDSGKKSNAESGKNSSKENDKKSNTESEQSSQKSIKNSSKENGKKSNTESGESSKIPGKNSSKENGKKSNTESGESSKIPGKNSSKENGKKSNTESGESSKIPGKNSSKENDKKSVSDDLNSEDESPAEYTKAIHYTKEQRGAATRIRHCSTKDNYGILDLDKDCSEVEIKDAYKKLSMLTHPDKNKYKDAAKAFKS
jgi:hypothetical protein